MMSWADDYVDYLIDRTWTDNPNPRKKHNKKSKQMSKKLNVGDIVRKKYGSKEIEVISEYGSTFYGRYLHTGASTGRIYTDSVISVNSEEVEEKGNKGMKGKLFKVVKTEVYGIGLAVDSTGKYVLEMKDGSGIVAYDKKEVELVMPFTFSVQFNGVGTEYSYLGKEGSVKVGDLLLKTDGTKGITIAKVTAVNTRSDKATKYFDGVKIVTEPLSNE